MSDSNKNEIILEMRQQALLGGGKERLLKRKSKGLLCARERIEYLLDEGSFEEYDMFKMHRCTNFNMEKKKFPGDGVITGHGTINNRLVYLFAHDFTVLGGSLSESIAEKICKIMKMAMRNGAPIVGLNDSGGARIQEGIDSLAGFSDIFLNNVMASGVVPQISGIFGPCAGGASYSPALTDFIVMVKKKSYMFLTGPKVIKQVTFEDIDVENLGGADVHNIKTGIAHYGATDEKDALNYIREIFGYIPSNNSEKPPIVPTQDRTDREDLELNQIAPSNPRKIHDIKKIITIIADDNYFFEIHKEYAPNLVVGFCRLNGSTIGVVANQPNELVGVLDCDASKKGARFVRFCDCFNIPILTFVDVPGFLPGIDQEHAGVIQNGAKLIFAYAEATVPKVTVIIRKAYGGAYCVMSSKHMRGDVNYAWPTAEIAVMGAKGAVEILHSKGLKKTNNPGEFLAKKEEEYISKMLNPLLAAERGFIDDIILPQETRPRLIKVFRSLKNKKDTNPSKKHGNIPL